MGASENKAVVRRLFEQGMNQRDAAVFHECVSADFVNHDLPGPEPGPQGFFESFRAFESAFPDLHVQVGDVLADDDRVITRSCWTGTHMADFMGVPASGASVKVDFIDIWRVDSGRVVECWVRMDLLGLMQQVGAIPA